MNTTLMVVALIAVALAATMTVVAIRLIGAERRRSAARVNALAAEIHGTPQMDFWRRDEAAPAVAGDMIAAPGKTTRPAGFGLAVLAIGGAVMMLVAVGFPLSRAWPGATAVQGSDAIVASPAVPQPLELVALGDERADDHLIVRGIVRNPERGTEVDHLTAVVMIFNRQGAFLTSGRVAIDPAALGPGAEARFAIAISGAADVGRYRVSFRTDARVVPHVDRREG